MSLFALLPALLTNDEEAVLLVLAEILISKSFHFIIYLRIIKRHGC